ncbi:hypothetical protein [Streptomyces sp. NBC_00247]|uniref:hypothetical protein n=1 Tax=Streptomyces sp. NBC_00247 TaxID=2975689 RepID=UPI003FA747A3
MKARARRKGRDPKTPKILLGTHVALGATEADAKAQEREWVEGVDIGKAVAYLQTVLSPCLRPAELPLDAPIPVRLLEEAEALRHERYRRGAAWLRTHHGQTVRQLALKHRQNSPHLGFTGTPEQVAAEPAGLFREGAANGFVLSHSHLPEGLAPLTRGVVPEMRRAGLFLRLRGADPQAPPRHRLTPGDRCSGRRAHHCRRPEHPWRWVIGPLRTAHGRWALAWSPWTTSTPTKPTNGPSRPPGCGTAETA